MVQHSYLGGNRRLEKRTIQEDKFIFILAFLDSDKVFYLFNCVLLFHEFLFVLGYFPPFSAGILILLCKKKKTKLMYCTLREMMISILLKCFCSTSAEFSKLF